MKKKVAMVLGFDLSTTALSCGVRSESGQEDFVSVPMRGKTKWRKQPAHDLWFVPGMILDCLKALRAKGWIFNQGGVLSFSVRQHDMVLLDGDGNLFMPALSWQCNAAKEEVARINDIPGVVESIGMVEPRFILPKLIWAFRQSPDILSQTQMVMTTGDWIVSRLTHNYFISTSDGLSNGLVDQRTKELASDALKSACSAFNSFAGRPRSFAKLFSAVIQSGQTVGQVTSVAPYDRWDKVVNILNSWHVFAGLGDNHAGAVGCGLSDNRTIVISAGTSGTVVRSCPPDKKLVGKAACFEYYNNRLLLMMLADCAAWYDRFAVWFFGSKPDLATMDKMAMEVSPADLEFWPAKKREAILKTVPVSILASTSALFASAQFSIAVELLKLVNQMIYEIDLSDLEPGFMIEKFVLTGGLSRSPFFQKIISIGIHLMDGRSVRGSYDKVFVSDREGPLANQAATLGAMINAMVGAGCYKNLSSAISDLCPLKPRTPGFTEMDYLFRKAIHKALKPYRAMN